MNNNGYVSVCLSVFRVLQLAIVHDDAEATSAARLSSITWHHRMAYSIGGPWWVSSGWVGAGILAPFLSHGERRWSVHECNLRRNYLRLSARATAETLRRLTARKRWTQPQNSMLFFQWFIKCACNKAMDTDCRRHLPHGAMQRGTSVTLPMPRAIQHLYKLAWAITLIYVGLGQLSLPSLAHR